jgi:hypothetical protein
VTVAVGKGPVSSALPGKAQSPSAVELGRVNEGALNHISSCAVYDVMFGVYVRHAMRHRCRARVAVD